MKWYILFSGKNKKNAIFSKLIKSMLYVDSLYGYASSEVSFVSINSFYDAKITVSKFCGIAKSLWLWEAGRSTQMT